MPLKLTTKEISEILASHGMEPSTRGNMVISYGASGRVAFKVKDDGVRWSWISRDHVDSSAGTLESVGEIEELAEISK